MSCYMFVFLCLTPLVAADSAKYIDLGRGFDDKTIYWTNVQPFAFTKITAQQINGQWYAANEFIAGEHGGTHLDAPYHFSKEGWKIGDIPVTKLIVPGVLMDMRAEVNNNPDFILKPHHIKKWEEQHGTLPENGVLLIRYGWGIYYNNKTKYFGLDRNGVKKHFPGLAADAAEYLAKNSKLVGVGIDTPSVDTGVSTTYPAHVWLQTNNMYIIENLDLEKELPVLDFTVIAMPMKITEGTGAPCRVIVTLNACSTVQLSIAFMTLLLTLTQFF